MAIMIHVECQSGSLGSRGIFNLQFVGDRIRIMAIMIHVECQSGSLGSRGIFNLQFVWDRIRIIAIRIHVECQKRISGITGDGVRNISATICFLHCYSYEPTINWSTLLFFLTVYSIHIIRIHIHWSTDLFLSGSKLQIQICVILM